MSELSPCPACGASTPAAAEWCGHCCADLGSPPAASEEPESVELAEPTRAGWECRACGHDNDVAASVCERCGTSIYDSYGAASERAAADPEAALKRAVIFPGLGYSPLGYGGIGAVVGFLAVACGAVAVMLLVAGELIGLFLLLMFIGIWVASVMDIAQLARGGSEPLLRPRVLSALGGVVVIVLFLMVLLTFQSATT